MINVSNEFRKLMRERQDFIPKAEITFSDGRVVTITTNEFLSNNSIADAANASSIPIGNAICRTLSMCILNPDEKYKDYYFFGATVRATLEFKLSASTEKIDFGTFTITEPESYGDSINITAKDSMYKADREFFTTLKAPVTARALISDICQNCGIPLATSVFRNGDFIIETLPDRSMTFRQVIGYIASIAVGNARINRIGRLEIVEYDFSYIGNYTPDSTNFCVLQDWLKSPNWYTSEVEVTGVQMTYQVDDEDVTTLIGSNNYALTLENPLVSGKEPEFVGLVADIMIGAKFLPFEGEHISYPIAEFQDPCVLVDRKGNIHYSYITDMDYTFLGKTTFKNSAKSPERTRSKYRTNTNDSYEKARSLINKQKQLFEEEYENLDNRIKNAPGYYVTAEPQEDGSTITYTHNKPTLEESTIIWKETAETRSVSTDGGKTWNAGLTADGDAIVRILTAVGINADWITAGRFVVRDKDGNVTFMADKDTGEVFVSGTFTAVSTEDGNKTLLDAIKAAEDAANEKLTSYAHLTDAAIAALQDQIDGQYETYFLNYTPTLANYPANEWTTEKLRSEHEGDLFYNKEDGSSYRFFKNDETGLWEWQVVTDTVATKALEIASKAQDTADGKRRVFVIANPIPPYDPGDLWFTGKSIKVCIKGKASTETFTDSDWRKQDNYIDEADYNEFIQNYQESILAIGEQLDGKAQTYYQDTDPSVDWGELKEEGLQDTLGAYILDTEGERILTIISSGIEHEGDLWYNTSDGTTWIYKNLQWEPMDIPDSVMTTIQNKGQIFVAEPTTPYSVGDLWVQGAHGDILRCVVAREAGAFNASDWNLASKYTDDSSLNIFINGEYSEVLKDVRDQLDRKAETWYQAADPSINWTGTVVEEILDTEGDAILDTEGDAILGIFEKEASEHTGDLWHRTTDNAEFRWDGSRWLEMDIPDEIFDTIDGKSSVFVGTEIPKNPEERDLWFKGINEGIYTYVDGEWVIYNKYTDDSKANEVFRSLNGYIASNNEVVEDLKDQVDGKIETFYQTSDPSSKWSASERLLHTGDLWYNSTASVQKYYRWTSTAWAEILSNPPKAVFDELDGKAQIFITQPKPPYDVGDLWFNSSTSDILTCVTKRDSGNYVAFDWQKRNKYTSDENLYDFVDNTYTPKVVDLQEQLDGKIETWFYTYVPTASNAPANNWTNNATKKLHVGDLFYNTAPGSEASYRYEYNSSTKTYGWVQIKDANVTKALSDASKAQNTADKKRTVFVGKSIPTPPYYVGDMWITGSGEDEAVYYCAIGRSSGNGVRTDWAETPTEAKAQATIQALNGEVIAKVIAGDIVNAIKLSKEGLDVQIPYTRLNINGIVSANNYFKINLDGSFETSYGKIGNIHIVSNAIYSGSHTAYNSSNPGFYFGETGIIGIGDANSYFRYNPSTGKMELNVTSLTIGGNSIAMQSALNSVIRDVITAQYTADAATTAANNAQNKANSATATANDAKDEADEAKKTATNFLYYDASNGLVITAINANGEANVSGSYSKPYNTQIKGDGIYFRNRTNILSYISGDTFTIYKPGGTNIKAMELLSGGLYFYKPNGTTVSAKYTADGLEVLSGIIGGFITDSESIQCSFSKNSVVYAAVVHKGAVLQDIAFAIKKTESGVSSYPFRVQYDGHVYCTDLDVTIGGTKSDNSDGNIALSTSNFSRTLGGSTTNNLRFAIGSKFGVTDSGDVYAAQMYVGDRNISNQPYMILRNGSMVFRYSSRELLIITAIDSYNNYVWKKTDNNKYEQVVSGTANYSAISSSGNLVLRPGKALSIAYPGTGTYDGDDVLRITTSETGVYKRTHFYGRTEIGDPNTYGSGDFSYTKDPQFYIYHPQYGNHTSSMDILYVTSSGQVKCTAISTGSSFRYKEIERLLKKEDIEKAYEIQPVLAKYKDGHLRKENPWNGVVMPMLIAEDVEEAFPKSVHYDDDGNVDDYDNHVMIAVHQQMLIEQKREIESLRKEVEQLKEIIGALMR